MLNGGFVMKLQAKVAPEVTGKIKRRPIESENIKAELMKNVLADNLLTTIEMLRVDVLIRNHYYTDVVSMKLIEVTDTLHLLESRTGWILTGRTKDNDFINKNLMMVTNSISISFQYEAFSMADESIMNIMQPHLEVF